MPKKVKVHPNERIDIPDFERDTEYAAETAAQLNERLFQARYPLVVEGFRVRIEDQAASPGEITVFNGTALDRDGKVLHDEDQNNVSKSITLPSASTTFYVEIEFVETESDTDARAFWDPTFDQTDPIPDGKEFSINVATRKTPSWRIVSPVSTTDFEVNSNPDSNKIPIAKLTTNASGEIDGPADLVQVFPSTVSEQAVLVGVNTVRVFDSRLFNVSDTITIGVGESSPDTGLAIGSIDYDNHIITFAPATSFAHNEGAIVRRTSGTGRIVQQDVSPGVGFLDATAAIHPDMANYAFRGNEIRGGALVQSKETFGERDDLNIRSLKDQVDALSAVIRELKFGDTKPSVTSAAPPDSFVSEPRWVDAAGGVTGARTNSVSVGDGSSTFGDFNGTGASALQSAIDALPSDGGLIFVKNIDFVIGGTVTIDKPVVIKGVGAGTNIRNFGGSPMFLINTAGHVKFEDVAIVDTGGDLDSIEIQADTTLTLDNVSELHRINITNSADPKIVARNVAFTDTIVTASSTSESVFNSMFMNCTFAGDTSDVFWADTSFTRCRFSGTFSSLLLSCSFTGCDFEDRMTLTANTSQLSFRECGWSASGTIDIQAATEVYFSYCRFASDLDISTVAEMVLISSASGDIDFKSCRFVPASVVGTSGSDRASMVIAASSDVTAVRMTDCSLETPAGTFADGVSFISVGTNSANLHMKGCTLYGFVNGVSAVNYGGTMAIESTRITGNGQSLTDSFFGIQLAVGGLMDLSVSNSVFDGYNNVDGNVTGIDISTSANVEITNTTFNNIGDSVNTPTARAIAVDAAGTNATIHGNIIDSVRAATSVEALYISAGSSGRVSVTGNVVNGLSGGSSDNAGIYIDEGSNVVVTDNVVDASGSDIDYGIRHDGDGANILIDNNSIIMGSSTLAGIFSSFGTTSGIERLSISNNTVEDLEGGNVGINVVLPGTARSIKINGNMVREGTFNADNLGIQIDGDTTHAENVSVNSNTVRADTGSLANRNVGKVGIRVVDCDKISVCNNVVEWLSPSTQGVSIRVENCDAGAVNDNVVQPSDGLSTDIGFVSATFLIVANNLVHDGTNGGTIDTGVSIDLFNNKTS